MKINNNILAILILVFIAVTIFNAGLIISKINSITGQSASASVDVSLTVKGKAAAPAQPVTGVSQGGGGKFNAFFTVSPRSFNILTETDSDEVRQINIQNIGDTLLEFNIESTLDIISFSKKIFSLNPTGEINIDVGIFTKIPGNYVGKIIVTTRPLERKIPITINIKSKDAKYNIELTIESEEIKQGEELPLKIKILELEGDFIDISYIIKDSLNRVITKMSENRPVNEELIISKSIKIPDKLREGIYIINVEVNYKGKTNVASEKFKIVKIKKPVIEEPAAIESYSKVILFVFIFLVAMHFIFHIKLKKIKF
ncbi:MAG: hypothetical protein AABY07_08700 [Nanoarchaeota archaeon]